MLAKPHGQVPSVGFPNVISSVIQPVQSKPGRELDPWLISQDLVQKVLPILSLNYLQVLTRWGLFEQLCSYPKAISFRQKLHGVWLKKKKKKVIWINVRSPSKVRVSQKIWQPLLIPQVPSEKWDRSATVSSSQPYVGCPSQPQASAKLLVVQEAVVSGLELGRGCHLHLKGPHEFVVLFATIQPGRCHLRPACCVDMSKEVTRVRNATVRACKLLCSNLYKYWTN